MVILILCKFIYFSYLGNEKCYLRKNEEEEKNYSVSGLAVTSVLPSPFVYEKKKMLHSEICEKNFLLLLQVTW